MNPDIPRAPEQQPTATDDPYSLKNAVKIVRKSGFLLAGILVCNITSFVASPIAAAFFYATHRPKTAVASLVVGGLSFAVGSYLRRKASSQLNQE